MSTIPAAFVERTRQNAVEHLLKHGTLRMADMLAESAAGHQTLFAIDMPPPSIDRHTFFQKVGIKFAMDQPNFGPLARASFAAEIWTVSVAPGESPAAKDFADDPRRREMLYVECWDATAERGEAFEYDMLRDASGQLVDVARRDDLAGAKLIHSLLKDFCQAYAFAREKLPGIRALQQQSKTGRTTRPHRQQPQERN